MKRSTGIAAVLIISLASLCAVGLIKLKSNAIGSTLSVSEAEVKFGKEAFEKESFKTSSTASRGKMAADLIKRKAFINLSFADVKKDLGEYTGYFWNDQIPTYVLNEGTEANSDVWQLVFLPGKDGRVSELIINKNCCDKRR